MFLAHLIGKNAKVIKFLIVGITSTVVDVIFLYIFVEIVRFPLFLGITCSFLLAVINGFTWNKMWTFKDSSTQYKRQFTKFLFVSFFGLGLTIFMMYIFTSLLSIHYLGAKLLTSVIVVIWNFLGNKNWTFKIKHSPSLCTHNFSLKYSIVVPAYNEEMRLPQTLTKIETFLKKKKCTYEIIVVDDGSSDDTYEIVKNLNIDFLHILKNDQNKGKGYSVRKGILSALGEYILFTDADNSTPIEELDNLEKYMTDYDIVIGSRYCEAAQVKIQQNKVRQHIGRIGNKIIQYFLLDGIQDTQCGFKLFKHHDAKKICTLQKINGFGFDMEMLLAGKAMGLIIKEVPVKWYNSDFSRVRPIRDSLKTLGELVFIKINYWFDGYK